MLDNNVMMETQKATMDATPSVLKNTAVMGIFALTSNAMMEIMTTEMVVMALASKNNVVMPGKMSINSAMMETLLTEMAVIKLATSNNVETTLKILKKNVMMAINSLKMGAMPIVNWSVETAKLKDSRFAMMATGLTEMVAALFARPKPHQTSVETEILLRMKNVMTATQQMEMVVTKIATNKFVEMALRM